MSLSTMARIGREAGMPPVALRASAPARESAAAPPAAARGGSSPRIADGTAAPPAPQSAPESTGYARPNSQSGLRPFLDDVAAFIPSEAVATYLALVALMQPDSDGGRWAFFLLGLMLVPLYLWLLDTGRLLTVTLLAAVAFTAWAAAMPATPFETLTPEATRIGGAAVIVLSGLLPAVAKRLGLETD